MLDSPAMATVLAANVDDGKRGIKQQDITVDTAVDDTNYVWTITFDDFVVTYTVNSGAGATTSTIGAQIRAAVDNDTDNDGPGGVDEFVIEGAGAAAVAEVIGKIPGDLFVVASTDTNLTVAAAAYAGIDTAEIEKTTDAIVGGYLASSVTADQNNYKPGGATFEETTLLVLTPDANPRTLTGLAAGFHRMLIIMNASTTNAVQLAHLSGSSDAANQFDLVGATAYLIQPRGMVIVAYDPANSRWRLIQDPP